MSAHLQGKSNLVLVARERGKIVARREGHNIWLNFGRAWLASLITDSDFAVPTPEQDNRLRYLGFGIGGSRQSMPSVVNNDPLLSQYPGTNQQLDIDPTVLRLERPVRVSWASGPTAPTGSYPNLVYPVDDVWLKQVQSPAGHVPTTATTFVVTFATSDITAGPFLQVPLSEIGLFHAGASINTFNNSPVALDTFDSIPKTASLTVMVTWTIRF